MVLYKSTNSTLSSISLSLTIPASQKSGGADGGGRGGADAETGGGGEWRGRVETVGVKPVRFSF